MTAAKAMGASDVEIQERTTLYQRKFRIDLVKLRHRKFDGTWTGTIEREVFERGRAAAVLPYDPQRDEVVLIEQFRVGALAAGRNPWQVEVVAGIIEDGESPAELAHREAREEAGLALLDLVPVGTFLVSPGGTSETCTLYCGRIDAAGAGGVHGLDSEDEDIRVRVMKAEAALKLLADGHVENAPAIIALQWLALNREALRKRWAA